MAAIERKEKQFNRRIDVELFEWLKQYAKQNKRSETAQLEIILEQEKAREESNAKSNSR